MSLQRQFCYLPGRRCRTAAGKLCLLVCLLLPGSAWAQPGPLFYVERDWTFAAGGKRYGLVEYRWLGDEKYGGGRRTTFWIGGTRWMIMTRTARVVEFAFCLGIISLLVLVLRGTKTEPRAATGPPEVPA